MCADRKTAEERFSGCEGSGTYMNGPRGNRSEPRWWWRSKDGGRRLAERGRPIFPNRSLAYEAQQSPGPELRSGATRAPLLRSRLGHCHRFLRRDHPPPNGSAFIHDDLVETSVPRVQGNAAAAQVGGCHTVTSR